VNWLVLGGTQFVGRHIVETALARGHRVSTFTRGNNPAVKGSQAILGDRKQDLSPLKNTFWDAIIDVNGYTPSDVAKALELKTHHYTFISTVSVYQPQPAPLDETSPLQRSEPAETVTPENYGGLKVLCEEQLLGSLIIRPHIVAGPLDPTDRFTYWVRRFAEGGPIIVPSPPEHTLQYIDARDQALFVVKAVEKGLKGIFNCAAPPVTWASLVEAGLAQNPSAQVYWKDQAWLDEHGISPWSDLPLWIPAGPTAGLLNISNARAASAGLTIRPLEQTFGEVLQWDRSRQGPLKTGLDIKASGLKL
jgi:2'-hydroxyisoflavone reductase